MSIKRFFLPNLQFRVTTQEADEEQFLLTEIVVGIPDFPPSFLMYLKRFSN